MEARHVGRAVVLGVALALVTRFGHHLPGDSDWVRMVGVPWLAVAFASAVGVRSVARGALLGMLGLVCAILTYYAVLAFVQDAYDRSPLGVNWLFVAIPGGAAFGALGARWSQGEERVLITALLSACFAGEAVLFHYIESAAVPFLLAGAVATPAILVRRPAERMRAMALAVPLIAVAAFAEVYVFLMTGYFAGRIT